MCGGFDNDDKEKELPEGYGEALSQQDENKTNEGEQEKYDEARRVW